MRLGERSVPLRRGAVEGHLEAPIGGWQAASCAPGELTGPAGLEALEWLPARVPGTAAGALCDAGRWQPGEPIDLDAEDWWFRAGFEAEPAEEGEEVVLALDGIATVAEVFLNGEPLLSSESMFHAHEVDVGGLLRAGANELAIRCLALGPLIEAPRRPRARWRTGLAANGLRFQRTMLLGRMPGPAPGPQAVGPWRGVFLRRRRGLAVELLRTRALLEGGEGVLGVRALLRALGAGAPGAAEVVLSGPSGDHAAGLELRPVDGGVEVAGALRIPDVARWWPHTHGDPSLHDVVLRVESGEEALVVSLGRAGFRELAPGPAGHEPERDGLDLRVNGVAVFARGVVWTPVDPIGLAPAVEQLGETLEALRDAGMNMIRLPGTGAYESGSFHDLCDALGLLVWQDFMFANMDYPVSDAAFRRSVQREAEQALEAIAGRPGLAVLCGNSEVEQQVAMLGLDPAIGRGELFGELLPGLAAKACPDTPYLPSSPCGGTLPIRADAGVAHYFGVGGYRRPLEDARRAGVRFAAECLAISNLGDDDGVDAVAIADAGVEWDFGDVRDHYLELLFDVDPAELRRADPGRYLALSRQVSGEVMAAVFGEWRRAASRCGGGLVLWSRDLVPGAGWGLLDREGRAKVALRHLRRALAPRAVWMTDEGLNGVGVHLANDGPEPFSGRLRVACYRDFENSVAEGIEELALAPHETAGRDFEAVLGRFADASWAYRFGPPAQDLLVASLERSAGEGFEPVASAFHFPTGRPAAVQSPAELGIEAVAERDPEGALLVRAGARRLVYGLRVEAPGFEPDDDALTLEPGRPLTLALRPIPATIPGPSPSIALTALNLRGRATVPPPA
jgi:beta-mannosidase